MQRFRLNPSGLGLSNLSPSNLSLSKLARLHQLTRTALLTAACVLLSVTAHSNPNLKPNTNPEAPSTAAQVDQRPALIIIIDDVGYNGPLGNRTVALPGPLNLAFLPHTPHAKRLARAAKAKGHGIMLHAPMANETGAALGPGALTEDMDRDAIQTTLRESIASIPGIEGVNNHMGSRLTTRPEHMQWVMEVVKESGLYFIDSLTNPASVAEKTAKAFGILTDQRHVFLDNDPDLGPLVDQFAKAVSTAERDGEAILIGHPYPETVAFLEAVLPPLIASGEIQLMRADEHLMRQAWLNPDEHPAPEGRLALRLNRPQ